MASALLVEDDEAVQFLVQHALQGLCNIIVAGSANQAMQFVKQIPFDIIFLDIGLPDRSGHELCAELRTMKETKDAPIFMISGRKELSEKVTSFSLGADDYITKPFDAIELQARVAARLRKILQQKEHKILFTYKDLSLNIITREVKIEKDNKNHRKLDLTPHEFKLLQILMSSPNTVFSREQILSKVWGTETFVEDRTIDKHISSLRKKLDHYATLVKTVTNAGYKFSTDES